MTDQEIENLKKKQPYYTRPSNPNSITCCNCGDLQIAKRAEVEYIHEYNGKKFSSFKIMSWCIRCGLPLTMRDNDRLFGQEWSQHIPKSTNPFDNFIPADEEPRRADPKRKR